MNINKNIINIIKRNDDKFKNIKFMQGEILLIDLGWNNYDREFAYIHPAIVIKETATKIFIVPCSSGTPRKDKNGNIYPEFEVGTINDGFQKNTTIMLYEAKYIDKNRYSRRYADAIGLDL